ncbi:hypothetical protein B0H13DRAFT_1900406 [Mycena leptocephala]|nr:hypothetical protein B0H13DRAFT_1900406 [Mycena leptocephala]
MREKDRGTNPIQAGLPDALKLRSSVTLAAIRIQEEPGHALFVKVVNHRLVELGEGGRGELSGRAAGRARRRRLRGTVDAECEDVGGAKRRGGRRDQGRCGRRQHCDRMDVAARGRGRGMAAECAVRGVMRAHGVERGRRRGRGHGAAVNSGHSASRRTRAKHRWLGWRGHTPLAGAPVISAAQECPVVGVNAEGGRGESGRGAWMGTVVNGVQAERFWTMFLRILGLELREKRRVAHVLEFDPDPKTSIRKTPTTGNLWAVLMGQTPEGSIDWTTQIYLQPPGQRRRALIPVTYLDRVWSEMPERYPTIQYLNIQLSAAINEIQPFLAIV